MGSKSGGCSPIVIHFERIGSNPGARITTWYDEPTSKFSGVRNEPSAAVRTGPSWKPTGLTPK